MAEMLTGTFGFESPHLTYAQYEELRGGGLELVPRAGLVEGVRAIKDDDELEKIRRAAGITDQAYEQLAKERFVGRTERELAWRMNEIFHELGADEPAFETIVAAGPNGAKPHADPGDRVIEAGTTVVVDSGAMLDGYCSDCTRTFATGELDPRDQEIYELVLHAQETALAAVRAGVGGREVDAVARDIITAAGHGEHFGHGLGHGVGAEVHEGPRLSQRSEATLAAGQVVTVEPGVYVPGAVGVRIEDLGVVTADGVEVLTSLPKRLQIVR
jgi:Xaa-Pro aminopeptidase